MSAIQKRKFYLVDRKNYRVVFKPEPVIISDKAEEEQLLKRLKLMNRKEYEMNSSLAAVGFGLLFVVALMGGAFIHNSLNIGL